MRRLSPHQSLGVSLASVGVVSGAVAISLGWVTPGPVHGSALVMTIAPPASAAAPE